MDYVTLAYRFITNWKNTKEKDIIIDPMICLIKLSILGFYPKGTKISISNNIITLIEPSLYQGPMRFINGDGREDLHNIYIPLIKSIEWYWQEDNSEIKSLFDFTIKGLHKLKTAYNENSTINHTLNLYIDHLENKRIYQNEASNNEIHQFLKNQWSGREIHIIIQMLLEYSDNNQSTLLSSVLKITSAKEDIFIDFLKKHFSSL